TRLQIVGLEAELQALPPDADSDRLHLHDVLAADYERLGDYRRALHHGQQELSLRYRLQGADHPETLITRSSIALWSGDWGHPAQARRLCQELLPARERLLGPSHPDTLTPRSILALMTKQCGHPGEALRLYQELLPDRERVLGPSHPDTLRT